MYLVVNKARMASESEIESFLKQLKEKILVFDLAFRSREKNLQALADLDITPNERKEHILALNCQDYYSGPNKDTETPGAPNYYIFGKSINGTEVYIKLSIGRPGKMVDCISFHPTDFPLQYPFRT